HPVHGHTTPGLQDRALVDYADLLSDLDEGLSLAREPGLVGAEPDDEEPTTVSRTGSATTTAATVEQAKYIFASCACRTERNRRVTIRMAKGSWREDVAIICSACGEAFGVSTNGG